MVEGILDGLRWLGLDWDEGPVIGGPYAPYFQSERFDRHRAMAERLVAAGPRVLLLLHAGGAEGEARRGRGAVGAGWRYDRTCCRLTADEIAARERDRLPRAVRFHVPEGIDAVRRSRARSDRVRRRHTSKTSSSCDPTVIPPTTCRSCQTMWRWRSRMWCGATITSRTRRSSILLYRALGAPVPQFAHVPLILGSDKKRLSKRHGATSVMEYARQGYLPEAMVNFLALLGWSPGRRSRAFTRDELVDAFSLDGISGGNAVFNPEKLDWFNQQHLHAARARRAGARV